MATKLTMTKLVDKLNELRALPRETEWIEFKVNYTKYGEIGEYISALSNSACLHDKGSAYLVYGVQDVTHNVVGTKFKPKQYKVGNEELENWLARLLEPRVDFEIIQFNYSGLPIVIFKIDATHNRPVRFSGTEYIRVGSYKKKLSDYPEKARKIWLKTKPYVFERGIALKNIDADDVFELLHYRSYLRLMGVKLPSHKDALFDKFVEEGLITRVNSHYNITNLGAILFADNLHNFTNLSRKAVRVIIYDGKNRLKTIREQKGHRGYAVSFEKLIEYINDRLPTNEVLGRALRREVKMYPEVAIRELVANALIHQDFSEVGTGPMVEIFSDRVEITNPGKPLISTLRFIDHNPQSRNETLAAFMRRMNMCEERGSGIDKVIDSVEAYQLPAPDFIEEDKFLKAVLYAHKTLRQMGKKDKIRACYQHCCLKYVSGEVMTNQSLRQRFKIDRQNYATVSRIISDTIAAGLIKDYDPTSKSRKFAKYVPVWA